MTLCEKIKSSQIQLEALILTGILRGGEARPRHVERILYHGSWNCSDASIKPGNAQARNTRSQEACHRSLLWIFREYSSVDSMLACLLFSFRLKGRHTQRERETASTPQSTSSRSSGPDIQDWVRQKLGVGTLSRSATWLTGAQLFKALPAALQDTISR